MTTTTTKANTTKANTTKANTTKANTTKANPIVLHDLGYAKATLKAGEKAGDKVGATKGLRITHYINTLFFSLLVEGRTDVLADDAAMQAMLKAEYPSRAIIQDVAAYRSHWNQGIHGLGITAAGTICDERKQEKPFALLPVPRKQRASVAPALAAKVTALLAKTKTPSKP